MYIVIKIIGAIQNSIQHYQDSDYDEDDEEDEDDQGARDSSPEDA